MSDELEVGSWVRVVEPYLRQDDTRWEEHDETFEEFVRPHLGKVGRVVEIDPDFPESGPFWCVRIADDVHGLWPDELEELTTLELEELVSPDLQSLKI